MSDIVKQGIVKAAEDLVKENQEKLLQEVIEICFDQNLYCRIYDLHGSYSYMILLNLLFCVVLYWFLFSLISLLV